MKLKLEEIQSATWKKLEEHYTAMLQKVREMNDSRGISQEETAHLRGRIAQIKEFLALAKQAPEELTDD